jgi:peptide/nickel transport system permease protein
MASGGDYSLAAQAWRRFKRHKLAMLGAWVLFAIAVAVVVAPMLVPFTFDAIDLRNRFCRPSWPHVFGTDELGHDVFVRLMYGGRISLLVGVTGATSATLAGVLIGSVAGFWGGRVDEVLMRFTDIMMTIPVLPLMLFAALLFKGGFAGIVIILSAFSWMGTARLVRGNFLSLRSQAFVEAAVSSGAGPARIVVRHLIPNSIAVIIVSATIRVSGAILYESTLSFLGFGIQPPTPSWGNMLQRSMEYLLGMPGSPQVPYWLIVFPGLFILLTVLSVNFIGDGLRDALDPKTRV